MGNPVIATRKTYAGVFMITLATLIVEILLTRIFSVTMWYHFAFMAISIAMFGMTLGAVIVYLFPKHFNPESTHLRLATYSLLFALTIIISLVIYLQIPFITTISLRKFLYMALRYIVISVPFIFSGICVSLALTSFPRQVSTLYFTDLVGAGCGCLLVILFLNITDGPTAVIAVSFLACLGALFFAWEIRSARFFRMTALLGGIILLFVVVNTFFSWRNASLLGLRWIKETDASQYTKPIYEKWNSFSRITISGDPDKPVPPNCWGLSSAFHPIPEVKQLMLKIDAAAATPITAFDGNLSNLEYLKHDITNFAHYLRPNANILIIGTGGGRDILSALAFKQKSILGVEINQDIISSVNGRFGDFSGHLDRLPNVRIVNSEARCLIARSQLKFDIIQASLIDTWAATAAGAFILTENSLYTLDAWEIFLDHLSPEGVLTFSRWYFNERPGEVYRLVSLASSALLRKGIANPRNHILVLRHMVKRETGFNPEGIGTIIVSREPFTAGDLDKAESLAREMQFEVVLSPRSALDETFARLGDGRNLKALFASYPLNIAPPTDDNPYFFQMLRLRDIFNTKMMRQGYNSFNIKAVFILGSILLTVIILSLLCFLFPFLLTMKREKLKGTGPLFLYFAAIGLGFMLVEIAQMQRLIIILGQPAYSLSVVLFSLLISSGLGSYLTQRMDVSSGKGAVRTRFLMLLALLAIVGWINPQINARLASAPIFWDIAVSVAILFAIGLFMGMAFPIGMKMASAEHQRLTPWLWGINGAMSVCASVLATAISLNSGISITFWTGFACYGVAFLGFLWKERPLRNRAAA